MKTLLVETREQLQRVVDRYLERGKPIFADTETTGLNHRTNKLVAVQMLQQGAEAVVIIDCRKLTDISQLNRLSSLRWVFHNAFHDWQFLVANGVELCCLYDSLIAEQVILSAKSGPSLKEVVDKYAGVTLDKDGREWFYEPEPLDQRVEFRTISDRLIQEIRPWNEPFPTEQIEYMANDVIYLDAVCTGQGSALRASGQGRVAMLEMRVIPAIARMEMNGVYVDVDAWREVINEQAAEGERLYDELLASDLAQAILKMRARELDNQITARSMWEEDQTCFLLDLRAEWDATHAKKEPGWGDLKKRSLAEWKAQNLAPPTPNKALREVNLGSHQQLKAGLDALGVRVKSTEADELEKASARYPVLKPLLAWRKTEKFVSTYGETLLERMGEDGRMHPRFNQIGAETGRMSSSKPNWQNIPARTEVGKRLRQCVVAPPGKMLLVGDFSIIELRILADLSGDETMMEMFASGMTFTPSPLDDVQAP
jgi:DNA polymerase I-like protein with 3'-5' exonuclease and polymerase domains